jgi:hypothetical protein
LKAGGGRALRARQTPKENNKQTETTTIVSGGVKPLLDGGARLSETVSHEGATGPFMAL